MTTNERTQIYIYPDTDETGEWWMAEIIDPGREPMVLPTPYGTRFSGLEVCHKLEQRNPGAIVDWFASKAEWIAGAA